MPERKIEKSGHSHHDGANSIDAVACLAALSWAGAAIVLSWWRTGVSLMTSLQRAFMGAIAVYAVVFVGLYMMIWMANKTAHGRRTRRAEKKKD